MSFWTKFTQQGHNRTKHQSTKLQVLAFCFEDFKNPIIVNILKHKLVISCFVGLFYLNTLQGGVVVGGGWGREGEVGGWSWVSWGPKKPPDSFSHVTSTNVGISPLNFVQNFKAIPSANSKFWTWTMSSSQKNRFFWSNLYKIKVMITSPIVILELQNFDHMTTFTI